MFARQCFSAAILWIVVGFPGAASADMFTPSHNCIKPHKPFEFTSESQVRSFRSDVDRYQRCINNFIEEQRDAAAAHQEAAEQAIDEWNRFVNFELQ